jgi:hypothetical protein
MATNHSDALRRDLAEIRRSVDEFRRELGLDGNSAPDTVTHSVKRNRGGALRAFRASRRKAPLA